MPDPYKEIYDEDEDIYTEKGLEELEEEDEISTIEEAFMEGYIKKKKQKKKEK
ncbi:MAG: hypothetical protein AABX29_05070 [Nanoarchaeota archaeon]